MAPVQRVLVSHGLAALAMSLGWPLLLVLVADRTGSTSTGDLFLGLTGAARMLPYVALSWATGSLADRFRRDRLVRTTLVARAVLLAATAFAVSQGWLLAAVLTATGAVAAGTPAYPALAAAMPGLAGAARRRATDTLVTIEVASFVVGPAIGGLLLAPASRPYLFVTAVVLTLVALVLLRGVVLPVPSASSRPSTIRCVLRTAYGGPGVRRAIGTVALLNGVLAAVGLTLLPLATAGGGATGFGLATGVLGFGALAAPLLWWCGRTSLGRARAGLLLLTGALALVPASPHGDHPGRGPRRPARRHAGLHRQRDGRSGPGGLAPRTVPGDGRWSPTPAPAARGLLRGGPRRPPRSPRGARGQPT